MTPKSAEVFFPDCNLSSFRNKDIVRHVGKEPKIIGNNIPGVTQTNRAKET